MMAAVITDADGVVVRNIMRSLRIDWTEIRDVTIGSKGILSRVAS